MHVSRACLASSWNCVSVTVLIDESSVSIAVISCESEAENHACGTPGWVGREAGWGRETGWGGKEGGREGGGEGGREREGVGGQVGKEGRREERVSHPSMHPGAFELIAVTGVL